MTKKNNEPGFKSMIMSKVLIALDYDPTAQKVAEIGYALARSMNAEITLLHVVADAIYYTSRDYSPIMGFTGFMDMGELPYINIDALKQAATRFLSETKNHLGDPSIKTRVGEGDDATAILEAGAEINADLIIMGSHSQRWLEKILIGSVTEEVLEKTDIPLFIIPTRDRK